MEIIGKEQRLTWNLPGAHQAHLAGPVGQPNPPPRASSSPCLLASCVARAQPSRGHLLLPPPPASLLASSTPWRRHAAPSTLSHSLTCFFPPLSLSARHHRTHPPPPTSYTTATATPSLPLRIPELCPDPVELHTRRTRPEEAPVDQSIVVFISGARRSPP